MNASPEPVFESLPEGPNRKGGLGQHIVNVNVAAGIIADETHGGGDFPVLDSEDVRGLSGGNPGEIKRFVSKMEINLRKMAFTDFPVQGIVPLPIREGVFAAKGGTVMILKRG